MHWHLCKSRGIIIALNHNNRNGHWITLLSDSFLRRELVLSWTFRDSRLSFFLLVSFKSLAASTRARSGFLFLLAISSPCRTTTNLTCTSVSVMKEGKKTRLSSTIKFLSTSACRRSEIVSRENANRKKEKIFTG